MVKTVDDLADAQLNLKKVTKVKVRLCSPQNDFTNFLDLMCRVSQKGFKVEQIRFY